MMLGTTLVAKARLRVEEAIQAYQYTGPLYQVGRALLDSIDSAGVGI
jgi:hypothetical protein